MKANIKSKLHAWRHKRLSGNPKIQIFPTNYRIKPYNKFMPSYISFLTIQILDSFPQAHTFNLQTRSIQENCKIKYKKVECISNPQPVLWKKLKKRFHQPNQIQPKLQPKSKSEENQNQKENLLEKIFQRGTNPWKLHGKENKKTNINQKP